MTIDILKNALADLRIDSNVESSAIISNDGILVTSDMDSNLNIETIACSQFCTIDHASDRKGINQSIDSRNQ